MTSYISQIVQFQNMFIDAIQYATECNCNGRFPLPDARYVNIKLEFVTVKPRLAGKYFRMVLTHLHAGLSDLGPSYFE